MRIGFERNDIGSVVSLRIGLDTSKVAENRSVQLFNNSSVLPNEYTADEEWDAQMVWGAFLGLDIPVFTEDRYDWQTGLAYYNTNDFDVSGVVHPNSDITVSEWGFNYQVKNQRFMWENKLLAQLNDYFSLYGLAGIGVGITEASGYHESPLDATTSRPNPAFGDNTTNALSYSFGLGIDLMLYEDLSVSLGYQFSDLGEIELGNLQAPNTSSQTLEKDNIPTNEVILALNYVFN